MRLLLACRCAQQKKFVCALVREGYRVDVVEEKQQMLDALRTTHYRLLVVSVDFLSSENDMAQLVQYRSRMGIVLLANEDQTQLCVDNLVRGADDFIDGTLPESIFIAKLIALHRRLSGLHAARVKFGDVEIDLQKHRAWRAGQTVAMARREFVLLRMLVEHRGQPVSRSALEDLLYSWHEEIESNSVAVHIHNLRKKFGHDFIQTMRGVGYLIDAA